MSGMPGITEIKDRRKKVLLLFLVIKSAFTPHLIEYNIFDRLHQKTINNIIVTNKLAKYETDMAYFLGDHKSLFRNVFWLDENKLP